jgi:predicted nucleic acid-binding protein
VPNPIRFGSVPLIADTTVWSKLKFAPLDVQADFRQAAREGLIVGSSVVRLEYLFHAKNHAQFDEYDHQLEALPELPLTPAICQLAIDALRALRHKGSHGNHKVKAPDALIAATAEINQVNVLHDDKHYAKLATVLNFKAVRFGPYPSVPTEKG